MTDRTKAMDSLIAQDADLMDAPSGVTEADRDAANRAFDIAFQGNTDTIDDDMAELLANHREQAAAEEREKIVAWLVDHDLIAAAHYIKHKEHLG